MAELRGKALQVTLVGFGFNCALAGIQGFAGWYCHSAALTSDAAHALGDSVSDLVTLASVRLMTQAVGAAWPYGLGKVDSLGALGVSAMLLTSGGGALLHSARLFSEAVGMEQLASPLAAAAAEHGHGHDHDHGHSHGHGHAHGVASLMENGRVDLLALATCLLTMVGKEGLFRITRRIAEQLNSNVLMANAWHHRSDALSSGIVLLGLLGRTFLHGAFDPLAGAVVSFIILRIGCMVGSRAVLELLDRGLSEAALAELRPKAEAVLAAHAASEPWASRGLAFAELSGRRAGPELWLRLGLRLEGGPSAWEGVSARELADLEAQLFADLERGGLRGLRGLRLLPS